MKAVLVIDCDKEELGEAVATITAKESGITFFARGIISPLPKRKHPMSIGNHYEWNMICQAWNTCLDEILGETK